MNSPEMMTQIEVDGSTYEVSKYPATRSVKILTRLGKLFGGPLGSLLNNGGLDAELDGESLGRAITELSKELDEQQADILFKDILCTTHVIKDGKRLPLKDIFDIEFTGRIGALFKLLIKVIQFQYADFADGLGALQAFQAPGPKAVKAR